MAQGGGEDSGQAGGGPATALYSPRRHRLVVSTLEQGRHHGLGLGDDQPHHGGDQPNQQEHD